MQAPSASRIRASRMCMHRYSPIASAGDIPSHRDVARLERVRDYGGLRLSLVELPMPRLPVDGAHETPRGRVFLQPFVRRVAVAAGDRDIEGDAVLMVRSSGLGSQVEAGELLDEAFMQELLLRKRTKAAIDRDLDAVPSGRFHHVEVGLERIERDPLDLELLVDDVDERDLLEKAALAPGGFRVVLVCTRDGRPFHVCIFRDLRSEERLV